MRKRLTFANIISLVALFFALCAGSYAAVFLPANSVGTKQLKNGSVTMAKLAARAINGSKVAAGSLTGADINVATLGTVPSAAAAPIAKVQIITASGASTPASATSGTLATATATCPTGTYVVGGGARLSDELAELINDSYPSGSNAWTADVFNVSTGTPGFTVYAICAPAAATG